MRRILRPNTNHLALIWTFGSLLAVATEAAAQPARPSDQGAPQVALLYDDQRLSDTARAKLFHLVAESVPTTQWRPITVKVTTDLRTVIDEYYDYYSSGRYSAPLTVKAAVEIIQGSNGITGMSVPAGTTLRIPPLPMRAHGRFDKPREFRVYSADVQGYAVSQNAAAVAVPTRRTMQAASNPAADPLRDASGTGIIIRVTEANVAQLSPKALPAGVVALSATPSATSSADQPAVVIGMITVELLGRAGAQCANPFSTLESSPFRGRQQARVAAAFAANGAALLAAADQTPLIVLDIGFASHHGAKVRRVAEQVLSKLGAPASLPQKIIPVEMYPIHGEAKAALSNALDDYVASQPVLSVSQEEFSLRLTEARKWITDSAASAVDNAPRLDIPEVLLMALFFKHVTQGAVLNMSFRMKAPATAALLNEFVQDAQSFSVAGVGNVIEPIRPGWTPQDAAMVVPNVINVTYGTEDGELKSEFPDGSTGARVRLLAPGCGFDGISEEGSSLATPYVAASVWLRLLLDRVESGLAANGENLARELLKATRPIHTLSHPVESGGMFDPAMMVAPPRPAHYLLKRDGTEIPLSSFVAEARCNFPSGLSTVTLTNPLPAFDDKISTYALFDTPKGILLWTRGIPASGFDRASWKIVCEVKDFSFVANDGTGSPVRYPMGRMLDFVKDVAFWTW